MKKVLFICRDNWIRSRVGAEFFREYIKKENLFFEVDSYGLGFFSSFFGKKLKKENLKGVNLIFVVEEWMKKKLVTDFGFKGKILNLKIPNIYWVIPIYPFKSVKKLKEIYGKIDFKEFI